MAAAKTARHRALIGTRSVRRVRTQSRGVSQAPTSTTAAIQIFISRLDAFLGTELFSAEEPVVVGRHRNALLRLKDEGISREHAQISLEGDRMFVEDLGSANGTLINRRRIAGRVEIKPSDALQLGPYTLRLRALVPQADRTRAASGISEADTKVDAVLSADGSHGTDESAVSIADTIDWRIYEEAIRRATGGEPARSVIHLRVVPEEERTSENEPGERWITNRDPMPELLSESAQHEPKTYRALEIDSVVAARIEELDRQLDRAAPRTPGLDLIQEDTHDPVWSSSPSIVTAEPDSSRRFDIVPSQHMFHQERDALESETITGPDPVEIGETEIESADEVILGARPVVMQSSDELVARSLLAPIPQQESIDGTPLPPIIPARPSEATKARARIPARLVTPTTPDARTERPGAAPAARSSSPAPAKRASAQPPPPPPATLEAPAVLRSTFAAQAPAVAPAPAPVPAPVPAPRKATTAAPPQPRSVIAAPPPVRKPTIVAPSARQTVAPPPLPNGGRPGAQPRSGAGSLITEPAKGRAEAAPPPLPKQPQGPRPAALPPSDSAATEQVPEADLRFDAVEVTARSGDKLLDIAALRKEGDQYVLGHRTPQGAVAPHSMHTGLRLLRITDHRFVDLVFPWDVAGHLVRDGETVMLRELTEGRKYSCLRLKVRDVATVILGEGSSAITYNIRFIRVPRAITSVAKLGRPVSRR